ncbi:hypothetical protein [Actinokineospora sp. UTMC 2448]|uniref:hypothetical protein n=1 Tax=Actinokineospora sp. UTMC 2448 TaxID=2268449 RepID=UPI00216437CA|nr:hypothetical protein [Actinokineospora sp. UTMC 2448]
MQKGPIFGAPTMIAPGETYDQAVLNWATYICTSGNANPGCCEWSYTIGNEPADGWDALFVVIGAAGLTAGGRGASVKAALKLTVDDVMTSPKLLAGMTPAQVEKLIGNTPNWVIGTMNKGRNARQRLDLPGNERRWHRLHRSLHSMAPRLDAPL